MLVDVMTEEIQVCDAEQALVGVDDNSVRGESSEYGSQVIAVLFWGGACDEHVVNVCICSRNTTEDWNV